MRGSTHEQPMSIGASVTARWPRVQGPLVLGLLAIVSRRQAALSGGLSREKPHPRARLPIEDTGGRRRQHVGLPRGLEPGSLDGSLLVWPSAPAARAYAACPPVTRRTPLRPCTQPWPGLAVAEVTGIPTAARGQSSQMQRWRCPRQAGPQTTCRRPRCNAEQRPSVQRPKRPGSVACLAGNIGLVPLGMGVVGARGGWCERESVRGIYRYCVLVWLADRPFSWCIKEEQRALHSFCGL